MEKIKIIDMHSHIYPEKIAAKASEAIGKFYNLDMVCSDGTSDNLKEIATKAGVVKVVIQSVATSPKQVVSINNFIINKAKNDDLFLPFATLHPNLTKEEIRSELSRIKDMGMKGIKMHPDFQEFAVDSDRAYRIFEELDGSLPILLHTGDKRKSFSHPKQMVKTAKDFPHIKFIAAHMGGYTEWADAEVYKNVDNVYYDTSSTLAFITKERFCELLDIFGEDKVMFGIDFPMWDYESELERINNLPISNAVRNKILFDNANKFMNLGI
jgi:predicted TIM-barrel fold metal-dependent hydrolase